MVVFNITFNIEPHISQQWLKWMKANFVPVVMQTKLPKKSIIMKLLTEVENAGTTYSFQFHFKSMEDFLNFEFNHKEQILDRHNMLFRGKFVLFSTLLEEIE